ncbi:hypothetical protein LG3211_1852 [Lysobacter gummosus]|nr:hypothetical protein LG3211_1852 [Lysobacter gummosus]
MRRVPCAGRYALVQTCRPGRVRRNRSLAFANRTGRPSRRAKGSAGGSRFKPGACRAPVAAAAGGDRHSVTRPRSLRGCAVRWALGRGSGASARASHHVRRAGDTGARSGACGVRIETKRSRQSCPQ